MLLKIGINLNKRVALGRESSERTIKTLNWNYTSTCFYLPITKPVSLQIYFHQMQCNIISYVLWQNMSALYNNKASCKNHDNIIFCHTYIQNVHTTLLTYQTKIGHVLCSSFIVTNSLQNNTNDWSTDFHGNWMVKKSTHFNSPYVQKKTQKNDSMRFIYAFGLLAKRI